MIITKKKIDTNTLHKQFNKKYKEKDGLNKLKNYKYTIDESNQMIHVLEFKSLYPHTNFKPFYHNVLDGNKITNKNKKQMIFS